MERQRTMVVLSMSLAPVHPARYEADDKVDERLIRILDDSEVFYLKMGSIVKVASKF